MELKGNKNKLCNILPKGLLLRVSKGKRLSSTASITVEASLVLPFFIFFFVNVLGVFDILKLQCDMEAAIHRVGSEISESAGLVSYSLDADHSGEQILSGIATAASASRKVKSYLGEEYLNKSCIEGKASGVSLAESAINSNSDIVDIVAAYKVHPILKLIGFSNFGMESRFYGHAFTGYRITPGSGNGDDGEEMVYVTEYGTVFHRSLSCSHLRLSIRSVQKSEIDGLRNIGGAKYYPCTYCKQKNSRTVFITDYGDRYHSKVNCSGLKRTIYTVPISQAGDKPPCSECG